MKKLLVITMLILSMLALCACGNGGEADADAPTTPATILVADFMARAEADGSLSAQDYADALITNEILPFDAATMPVEPGYVMGFTEEITDFNEAVMFAPMIGTIPFIGYVFTLDEGADTAAFIETLNTTADLRWNICTAAEEMVGGAVGNKVCFVMAPMQFEAE